MKKTLAAAAALSVLAPATAVGAPPKKSDLRAVDVQAPAFAHRGGSLPVRLTAAAGNRPAKKLSIRAYLSGDRRYSKRDVKLAGTGRIMRLERRSRAEVAFDASLPKSLRAGSQWVIVCLDHPSKVRESNERNNCRTSKAKVAIAASADDSKSSAALIEADRKAGRLSAEQALTYRVFAMFGDSRLPARYAGDVSAAEDDSVMREAAQAWPRLSKGAKRKLARYLAPPPLRRKAAASASASADEDDPCYIEEFDTLHKREWRTVSAAGGKVKIHWQTDRPDDGRTARALAPEISTAYARYKGIMGREPLSDGKVKCWHGPDGALDIYFDVVYGAVAVTVPSAKTKYTTPDCAGMPSYIVSDPDSLSFSMNFVLAHELFHAFQNAFTYTEDCETYKWFDEASANWAAHAAFPNDNSEHFFKRLLDSPSWHLHYQDYDGWPFVLWMAQRRGESSIRRAYEEFAERLSLPGVDRAIGGFREQFLDFAKHGWNQAPVPAFEDWDGFQAKPERESQHLFLAGQRSRTASVPFALGSLERGYHPFTVTDEKVKRLVFRNELAGDPDARIGAIITFKSGATRFDDWSGKKSASFCLERPGQDVQSLVIVYANSAIDEHDIKGTPQIDLHDDCGDDLPWHFKVLGATLQTSTVGSKGPGDGFQVCGMTLGLPIREQQELSVSTEEPTFNPDNRIEVDHGALSGRISVRAPANVGHTLEGCKGLTSSEAEGPCSRSFDETNEGMEIGFAIQAPSKDADTVTLHWYVPDPMVGFMDFRDEVCNVMGFWQPLAAAKREQQIPLARLTGTDVFHLAFQGDGQWTTDSLGYPANITYGWTYAFKLQRVDAEGNPL